MTITPEDARKWLGNATPGPWDLSDGSTEQLMTPDGIMGCENPGFWISPPDATLICFAPDMAQTLAGMHEEWAKEFRVNGGIWIPEMWHRNRSDAERDQYMRWRDHTTTIESRLVRRLVSETEVVES